MGEVVHGHQIWYHVAQADVMTVVAHHQASVVGVWLKNLSGCRLRQHDSETTAGLVATRDGCYLTCASGCDEKAKELAGEDVPVAGVRSEEEVHLAFPRQDCQRIHDAQIDVVASVEQRIQMEVA